MAEIILDKINYTYSDGTAYEIQALKDVNLQIHQGEFIGIIGHTGSGKSTLTQLLNGLLRASSGSIYVDGQDIYDEGYDMKALRSKVGLVFQYPDHQLFETTCFEDVCFGPKNQGLSQQECEARALEALKLVGLKEKYYKSSPFELSGGQKRRVAIAGVLAMRPKVLVLDEPTAGLDPKGRDRILGQIQEYQQDQKNTVLIVSHSMEDVAKFAKKVLVMNQSKVFMYDDTEKVFEHASEIEQMGLAVPQVTKIFMRLADMGYPVDPHTYTIQAAKQQVLRLFEEQEAKQKKGGM